MRRTLPLFLLLGACGQGKVTPPSVDAVTPADTASGLVTPLQVDGRDFSASATIVLRRADEEVVVDTTVLDAGTRATGVLPAGLSAGLWDVVVRNGRAEGVLAAGFTVYDGVLEMTFFDVGQGDATFVRSPRGDSMLIDGGPGTFGRTVVRPILERRDAFPPDYIVVSHRDYDHLGGIVDLLVGSDFTGGTADDVRPTRRLLDYGPDPSCTSATCERYDAAASSYAELARAGERIDLGAGVTVTIVAVNGELLGGGSVTATDENARSVAVVVSFGRFSAFVGGDLTGGGLGTSDVESELARRIGPVDLLRVSHHGSTTSSNNFFLATLQPVVAVLSVGTDNPFCHPHDEVLARLSNVTDSLWLTNPGIVTPSGNCAASAIPAGAVVTDAHVHLTSRDGLSFDMVPLTLDDRQAGQPTSYLGN